MGFLWKASHRIVMNVLIASLHEALVPRKDYFTGGNMLDE